MKSGILALGCALAFGSLVSGCGGGGGSDVPVPPVVVSTTIPEGLYNGTTSTSRTITGLVLDDGTYYVLYSAVGNASLISGVIQGTGTASGGKFTSSNAKDINLEGLGVTSGSVSATFTLKSSLGGTVTYSNNQSTTFSSTYDAKYELTPSLATIAGTYSGTSGTPLLRENATLTVSTTGAITGTGASGCTFAGTVVPRSKGNVYNASITFGSAPCAAPGLTVSGGAYFDAATKRLYAVALTSARDTGVIYVGTKP